MATAEVLGPDEASGALKGLRLLGSSHWCISIYIECERWRGCSDPGNLI